MMNNENDIPFESRLYCCFTCRSFVAIQDDITAKDFVAGASRAFLFSHVKNVELGPAQDRQLISGKHTVSDVYCSDCGVNLGWKYIKVYNDSQSYKLGKTVLVKSKIAKLYHHHHSL